MFAFWKIWSGLFFVTSFSGANKYSSAIHHEQKNKKATVQIKFYAVSIK